MSMVRAVATTFLVVCALAASAESIRGAVSYTAPPAELNKPLACPIGVAWNYSASPPTTSLFSLDMAILSDGSRRCFSGPYASRQLWEKPPLFGTVYGQDDVVGTFYMSFPSCGTPSLNGYCNEGGATSDITEHDRGQGYLDVNWGKFHPKSEFCMANLPWDTKKRALVTGMKSVDQTRHTSVYIYCSGASDAASANFQCYGSSCNIQVYVGVSSGTLCDADELEV